MLSKNKIKFIQSLAQKKERNETGCFLAEGNKLIDDTIGLFDCPLLVATESWHLNHPDVQAGEKITASTPEIAKASLLKSPQDVLAVYRKPIYNLQPESLTGQLILALDTIQDPGNLGTIVRLADWFGIEHLVCSPDCADLYNPKTVQATMGAIARVKVHYMPLEDFFGQVKDMPVYGTFLDGQNMYETELTRHGIIVMGNEGNGISARLEPLITKRLYIPSFPSDRQTSESLNVAIATAVICAEFRRP